MSAQNVLRPSAPPEQIYPDLPSDFQMRKINEISATLRSEVDHYRAVAKKYKRTKFVNYGAGGIVCFQPFFLVRVSGQLFL